MGCVIRLAVFCVLAAVGSIARAYADDAYVIMARPADCSSRHNPTPGWSSAVQGTGDLATIPLALHIVLQPGWKTYWRSPGDAGYPLQIDVSGSDNVEEAKIAWPVPHRFQLFGLQTFGYGEEVAFPVMVTPVTVGAPIALKAKIRYLVCETICVPQDGDLTLDLPQGDATPSSYAPLVNRFASLVPKSGERLGWSVERVAVDQQSQLVVDAKSTGEVFERAGCGHRRRAAVLFRPAQGRAVGRPPERAAVCAGGASRQGRRAVRGRPDLTFFDGDRGMEVIARPVPIAGRRVDLVLDRRCCRSSASRCSAGSSSTSCPACCRSCC